MAKKDMVDLEKGMDKQATGAPDAAQIGGGEQEHLVVPDLQIDAVGIGAASMNPGLKLLYYLVAGSTIVLTNHVLAATKDQLIAPEFAIFTGFLCAIGLIFHKMKQMM